MANTYIPPQITVEYSLDHDAYLLLATDRLSTVICGERILRAEPWPEVKWRSDTQEEAERHAATLRLYLAECASGKRRDKAPALSVGADYWTNL
jgi:hypothetical protein